MIDTPLLSNKVHQAARNVPTRSDQTWLQDFREEMFLHTSL